MFKRILIANRGEIACRIIKICPPHGHRDGRGLFRGRPRRAARRDGRYGGRDRPAAGGRELSGHRQDRRRLPQERRRGGASGLRLPVRARGVPGSAGQGRHRLHRAQSQGHRRHGRQDREQEGGGRRQRLDRAGPSRRDLGRTARGEDRRRDRLPGDDQGVRRRRRQGHADRPFPGRGGGRLCARPLRGAVARSATTACSSRNSSSIRAMSRSRCSATSTATSSISASANARSSAATRRSSRRRRARCSTPRTRQKMGEQAVALAKAVGYDSRRHRRIRRRAGQAASISSR